jgi:hypothetical protein
MPAFPVSQMKNDELKAEADLLIRHCGLQEILASYERWFVGGSYAYDLMCWRDLDIYALDPAFDLKHCFEVGYEAVLDHGVKSVAEFKQFVLRSV